MCFNPVDDKRQSVPTEKTDILKVTSGYKGILKDVHLKRGSAQCLIIPHSPLHIKSLISKAIFNIWKLKLQMSNIPSKTYLNPLPLKKDRLRKKQKMCVRKCHRKPKAENQHKTVAPHEIKTR